MVADQRKKRANAASLVGCTSREQCKVNRKKLKVQKHGINMMPNISLEWDNKKKTVVSKRGQIGIARRHLISFLEPGSAGHSILADVCSVPQEIFELENLREVLTYEVWQSNLTDTERYFLSQFLPKVPEPDITIQDLLAGEDFQFGNPFVKWGSSLCYGELHPDNILHKEPSLKAVKKAYYLDLQKYHSCMIVNLEKWKEKWASCKDPEEEIVQNLWSSKRPEERNVLLLESRVNGNEENLVTTPESYSWNNSEVAYSSDNQNLGTVRGESKRGNGFLRKISDNSLSELKVVTSVSRKGEQVHKQNIQQSDGTKYMSYIKVSREQHERVKSSMNNASNCIHPRSLNNVLGTDALNVQPYERFVEEEKKKLHQHWLKLATSDIPEGFAYWVKRELQKQALARSLGEEIGHKMELQTTPDEEKKGSPNEQMDLSDDSEDEFLPPVTAEDVDEEQSGDLVQEQEDIYEHTHDVSKMTGDEDMPNQVFIEDNNQQQLIDNSPRRTMISSPSPVFYQQQNGSLNTGNHPQDDSLEIGLHGDKASSKTDEDASIASEYPVEDPLPSYGDIWPVGDVHGSYYHESMNARYVPAAQELSIGNHPQQFITEQEAKLLDDMEIDSRDKNGGGGGKDMPSFDSYANLNRNEIYHSLRDSVYHGQQKQSEGLGFQPGNNDVMVEAFPGQFRDQVYPMPLPLDLRQKRPNDNHLYPHHHNIQESSSSSSSSSIFPGGRFLIPRQDGLPVSVMQDWTAVNSNMRQQQQLSQNWFNGNNNNITCNNGTRDGWPSSLEVGVSGQHGRNSDETLFSVLSECNELPPRASYNGTSAGQRIILAGNYTSNGIIGGGISAPPGSSSSSFLQQSTANPPLSYGGHEAAAIKMNNLVGMGWMGMPQQSSGLHDSLAKSFLGSWNQP